jgi:predicted glycosyltransferase
MKILFYCQHVLGIGHYFRSIEICSALRGHSVTLVLGGPPVDLPLPEAIHIEQLPCLMMDRDFSALSACEESNDIETIKREREQQLVSLVKSLAPDIFLIELYPFGRKAFSFELVPAIEAAKSLESCKVVCSLRDILVEKQKQETYEERVVKILNRFFDGVLVHSDPLLLPLTRTFNSVDKIDVPLLYTGFVARKEKFDPDNPVRNQLGIGDNEILVVASAGSGAVGYHLLNAIISALPYTQTAAVKLVIFAGPHMEASEYASLQQSASGRGNIFIHRFTKNFLSYLRASDLSISMAGYNTCMNIMATNTPALMWPFSQNREQRMRAELLGKPITVLEDDDFEAHRLAYSIDRKLAAVKENACRIDLDGAEHSARLLEEIGGQY